MEWARTNSEAYCYTCGTTQFHLAYPLKDCSKCETRQYCSRECQTADWKTHEHVCGKARNEDITSTTFTYREMIYAELFTMLPPASIAGNTPRVVVQTSPDILDPVRAYVAFQFRTGGDKAARFITPEWKEGGARYEDTIKVSKFLFISHGGYNYEDVSLILPKTTFQDRPYEAEFYITEHIRQTIIVSHQNLMEKFFCSAFRDFVFKCRKADGFHNVAGDVSKIRDWCVAQTSPKFIHSIWNEVIGDAVNLNYIFGHFKSHDSWEWSPCTCCHDDTKSILERQATRLIQLFGHAAQLYMTWDREIGGDMIDKVALFDAFANVWREESMMDPECKIKLFEWAFHNDLENEEICYVKSRVMEEASYS